MRTEFAISLDLSQVQFSILVPLPGTTCFQLAQKMEAFRVPTGDFERFYWYYSVAANFTDIQDDRLIELQQHAYQRWKQSRFEYDY